MPFMIALIAAVSCSPVARPAYTELHEDVIKVFVTDLSALDIDHARTLVRKDAKIVDRTGDDDQSVPAEQSFHFLDLQDRNAPRDSLKVVETMAGDDNLIAAKVRQVDANTKEAEDTIWLFQVSGGCIDWIERR